MSNQYSGGNRGGFGRAVRGRSRSGCTTRIVLALILVGFAMVKFMVTTKKEMNPYTGEVQRIALTPKEEIEMGLQSVQPMAAQHGGLHPDQQAQAHVDRVGQALVAQTNRILQKNQQPIPYPYEFHLLADERAINAFALPGGQIFITAALYAKLENEDQLAGVLGHEVGHVLAKHSNVQMSKRGLLSGIGQAIGTMVGGGGGGDMGASQMVTKVLSTKYGREDELESDKIGAILMYGAGYNPEELIGVMKILKASGGGGGPEIFSSHPNPDNRMAVLKRDVLPMLKK